MVNLGDIIKKNIKEHNPNWPQIPDHPNKILEILDLENEFIT